MKINNLIFKISWPFYGFLAGALAVGTANFYLAARYKISPEVHAKKETEKPVDGERELSLKPVDEFSLVKNRAEDTAGVSETEAEVQQLESSQLPLELVGTMLGPGTPNLALVRDLESREVKALFPGDEWKNIKLDRVYENRIIFQNTSRSQEEVLRLERASSSRIGRGEPDSSSEVQEVSRYRVNQHIHNNMNNLLASVDAGPELRQGKIIGFRLKKFKGRPKKLLKQLGFRQGDILTRVNGRKVDSMEKALSLWSQLRNKKNFRVTVLRNGKKRTLEYQLTR